MSSRKNREATTRKSQINAYPRKLLRTKLNTPHPQFTYLSVFTFLALLGIGLTVTYLFIHQKYNRTERTSRIRTDTETFLSFGTRVSGSQTSGWVSAQRMILGELGELSDVWRVEVDEFTQQTVLGTSFFSNTIATLIDGDVQHGHIVLAAHFDSKLFNEFVFLGVSDSAVPCMILLDIARKVASVKRSRDPSHTVEAQPMVSIVFFDGEEAFKIWTDTDSLYGSRHLASKWETSGYLSTITLFVLLDLLGPSDSVPIPNYFSDTIAEFTQLYNIEQEMIKSGTKRSSPGRALFLDANKFRQSPFIDDHVPFLQRGVRILHLARAPFHSAWHSERDTLEIVDWDAMFDLSEVLNKFLLTHWISK